MNTITARQIKMNVRRYTIPNGRQPDANLIIDLSIFGEADQAACVLNYESMRKHGLVFAIESRHIDTLTYLEHENRELPDYNMKILPKTCSGRAFNEAVCHMLLDFSETAYLLFKQAHTHEEEINADFTCPQCNNGFMDAYGRCDYCGHEDERYSQEYDIDQQ